MEKISIQSSYSQVSLYAKLTVNGPGAKPQDGTAAPTVKADDGADPRGNAEGGKNLVASNQDGDTFTLSVEARAIQVSRSITIETTEGGKCGRPSEDDRLSGQGKVDMLMDALDHVHKPHRHGHGHRGHGHYPQFGDAEDLAARLKGHWDKEHAEKGGSREDFAAAIRQRMSAWEGKDGQGASTRVTMQYQEFRTEVSVRISASLSEWEGGGSAGAGSAGDSDPAAAPQAEA